MILIKNDISYMLNISIVDVEKVLVDKWYSFKKVITVKNDLYLLNNVFKLRERLEIEEILSIIIKI